MSRAKTTAVDEVSATTGPVEANTAESGATAGASGRAGGLGAAAGGTETASTEGSAGREEVPRTAANRAAEGGAAATSPDAAGGGAAVPPGAGSAAEPQAEPAEGDSAATAGAEATDSEATEPEADQAQPATEPTPAKPRPAWRRLPALLLAAAVVLAGAGVWFTLEARSAAANPAASNLALTDVAATADVTSAVTLAVNRIFSYSYDRTDVTEKAAAAVLRGAAKDSYDKLFAEVRRKAPEQKLVLTSRVSAIAVQELKNGHARLLVFLDQSAVRADNNATDSAAAQLSVTAEHTGDGWVVTELEPR